MQENQTLSGMKGKKRRRNENRILLSSIILCLVTMSAITVCLAAVFRYRAAQIENVEAMNLVEELRTENEQRYTQEELDDILEEETQKDRDELLTGLKERLLSGEGVESVLRDLFPEEVVLSYSGEYYFFPILDTLKHHSYQQENYITTDDGLIEYYEDGERISHMGIDVSRYQEEINWNRVAEEQVEFAFIRLGIRGYTEGEIIEDETFEDNIKGALGNGISVGVYFFTQALSVKEAEEEARFVLDTIEPYRIDCPVILDVEIVLNQNARTKDLTREERTQYCIAFCEMIKEAGYRPMIYGNLRTFFLLLDLEQLEDYDKWLAFYGEKPYYPYDFKVWQYTESGSVSGIGGEVDLNISFEDWWND